MAERWVVNASPLIILSKINHQDLIWQLAAELIVPDAVLTEISAGPANDPARLHLEVTPISVVAVEPEPIVSAWDLGAGESAVLAYAMTRPGWKAVIDDGVARRCARALDIPLIGTLGIIIRACQINLIPAAAPLLKELQMHGFHLDDAIIKIALQETLGENWP